MEILDLLLEAGADPLIPNEKGETPLENVAQFDTAILQKLLKIPAVKTSIKNNSNKGRRAFLQAIHSSLEYPERMDMFLKAGADLLRSDEKGNTPLMVIAAPFSGERKVFGRSKNNRWRFLEDPEKVYPWQKDYDDTLLECFENKTYIGYDNDVLKQLLNIPSVRAKDSIDAQNLMGETALFLTAKVGIPVSMYLLLEAGADPLIANKKGKTPLEAVAQGIKCERQDEQFYSHRGKAMLNRLLEIPSVRQNITEREAYWLSLTKTLKTFIKLEDIESIRNLLKYFNAEEINSKWRKLKPKEGESLLDSLLPSDDPPSFIATTDFLEIIETGHLETVNVLLEAGADPLIPNGDGNNALMIAVLSGHTIVVERLLEIEVVRSAINRTNKQGDSALSIAAELGHQEIINLLQAAGANSEIPHREGKKTEKKKLLHTKKDDAGKNNTRKNREQSLFLRETAEAEKKKTSLPEDSFWERALSGLKKLLY